MQGLKVKTANFPKNLIIHENNQRVSTGIIIRRYLHFSKNTDQNL